jgi:hypothetical protein
LSIILTPLHLTFSINHRNKDKALILEYIDLLV